MRNISISQFVAIIFIGILLFSDFSKIVNYFRDFIKNNKIYKDLKKSKFRKKGIRTLDLWFWKPLLCLLNYSPKKFMIYKYLLEIKYRSFFSFLT